METVYTFYTDGAFSSKRNQGGASVVIIRNDTKVDQFAKTYKNCTNNQMEVIAVILALYCIKNPIDKCVIISDSMYTLGCSWKYKDLQWKRNKNKKLWIEFDKAYNRANKYCKNIEFVHVKGHDGDKYNELADTLAVEASQAGD